ncbi:MAG TPA: serine protease [Longimicrobiaceae bacterium]
MRRLARTIVTGATVGAAWLAPDIAGAQDGAGGGRSAAQAMPSWARSVVRIWFECNNTIDSGAGVVISKSGRVLTAAHVGRSCTSNQTRIFVGFVTSPYQPPTRQYAASRVHTSVDNLGNPTAYDLALLQIVNPDSSTLHPAVVSRALPMPGDDALVVGFPRLPYQWLPGQPEPNLSVLRTHLLSVATATPTDTVPSRLHYGGGTLSGMSGGPVFDRNGHLVGIHSARATANIVNLLNENCPSADYQANRCSGNALRIDYRDHAGANRTQVVNVSYFDLKALLENYGWATSIWRVPESWLQ